MIQSLYRKPVLKNFITIAVATLLVSAVVAIVTMSSVSANTDLSTACNAGGMADSAVCKGRGENVGGSFGQNIVNTMLFVLGIVAVVMIIFGGFKYVTANGDASKISSAKNTILYSVVGLVVAIMAWGIVTFVVNQVIK